MDLLWEQLWTILILLVKAELIMVIRLERYLWQVLLVNLHLWAVELMTLIGLKELVLYLMVVQREM